MGTTWSNPTISNVRWMIERSGTTRQELRAASQLVEHRDAGAVEVADVREIDDHGAGRLRRELRGDDWSRWMRRSLRR